MSRSYGWRGSPRPARVCPDGSLERRPFGLFGPLGHLDQDALVPGAGQLSGPAVPLFGLLEELCLHMAVYAPLNGERTGPARPKIPPNATKLGSGVLEGIAQLRWATPWQPSQCEGWWTRSGSNCS